MSASEPSSGTVGASGAAKRTTKKAPVGPADEGVRTADADAAPAPASSSAKASSRSPSRRGGTRRGAAHQAVRHNSVEVHVPVLGRVDLPPPDHLAWYAAVGVLAALEIVEWPVAAILAVGKALSDSHRNKAIEEFGEALDEVA